MSIENVPAPSILPGPPASRYASWIVRIRSALPMPNSNSTSASS